MNYWITTQWPPLESQTELNTCINIPSDRGAAGKDLNPGDIVLIYQSKTGRNVFMKDITGVRIYDYARIGREGIISIQEVTSKLFEYIDSDIITYTDGSAIKWSWEATTKELTSNGFVSREKVNKILGYKRAHTLRGFGDLKSGLKKITAEIFYQLVKEFKINQKDSQRKFIPFNFPSGESKEHFDLKNYVSIFPEQAIGETELAPFAIEYSYPTGDKCDVVLKDQWGKYVAVEIELEQDMTRFEGLLQAIKYRYMLAVMKDISFSEVRAMLVAFKISPELKLLCNAYDVEFKEIKREEVVRYLKLHQAIQIALLNSKEKILSFDETVAFINAKNLYHEGQQIQKDNIRLRVDVRKENYGYLFEVLGKETIKLR